MPATYLPTAFFRRHTRRTSRDNRDDLTCFWQSRSYHRHLPFTSDKHLPRVLGHTCSLFIVCAHATSQSASAGPRHSRLNFPISASEPEDRTKHLALVTPVNPSVMEGLAAYGSNSDDASGDSPPPAGVRHARVRLRRDPAAFTNRNRISVITCA